MIKIWRGPEPLANRTARLKRHPIARAAAEQARRDGTDFKGRQVIKGYDVSKERLSGRQNGLCAYCNQRIRRSAGKQIDHHRPASAATGHGQLPSGAHIRGYWWLAWTWENLLVACGACNGHKGTKYAIDGSRLPEGAQPPGQERPRLLDPANEDPSAHLVFTKTRAGKWRIAAAKGSKGTYWLNVTKLDQDATFLDGLNRHFADFITLKIDALRHALASNSGIPTARSEAEGLLNPEIYELVAFTHQVLTLEFEAEIAAGGLAPWPKPWMNPPIPEETTLLLNELNALPAPLLDELARANNTVKRRVVFPKLRAHRTFSVEQLATILRRAISTIQRDFS